MDRNIVLIGPMGSGKTTVGRRLADRLGWTLVDTDQLVVAMVGRTIPEIFATDGEAEFRRLEEAAVDRATRMGQAVIATGGGVPLHPGNRAALRARGWVVWLQAPAGMLLARMRAEGVAGRPLLQGENPLARLEEILSSRDQAYRQAAHWILDTAALNANAVVDRILHQYRTLTTEFDSGRQDTS